MASEFVVLAKKRRKKIRSVSFITYITVSHQNSLQQKYSNNDTIANHSHLQLYMGGDDDNLYIKKHGSTN